MLAAARDVAIIILAAETIVVIFLLLLIAWKGFQLVRLIQAKTVEYSALGKTVIQSAQATAEKASETATTVKGTTAFISETVVSPVVQVMGAAAGARAFVSALFRLRSSPGDGGLK